MVYPDGEVRSFPLKYHIVTVLDGLIPPNLDLMAAIFPKSPVYETRFGGMGMLFCMEGGFPAPTNQLVRDGADFIVITTGDVSETFIMPWQFISNAVYRAVEHRIPVVHVMNFERSVIVEPYGRVTNDVSTSKMAVGKLAFSDETTFYTRYGDVFGWTVVGLALVLAVYNTYLRRRSPFIYCKNCRTEVMKGVETCDQCGASQRKPPLWKRR